MARLEITKPTLKRLFALSGNRCAFPGCRQAVFNEHGDLVAEVCHIEAANEDGQRYNADQSDEDRRGFDNLLVLCPNHHKITDNVAEYPVERLMQYPCSLAITWQTLVDQRADPARRLLHRLARFAPDPIPESLLDSAPPFPHTSPTRQ